MLLVGECVGGGIGHFREHMLGILVGLWEGLNVGHGME